MTEPEALVAAAAIGGLAAPAGALVAGGTALRNETRRGSAGRKDVERQALRACRLPRWSGPGASRHMPFTVGVCLLHGGREFPGTNGIGARREPSRAAWTPNVMTGPGPPIPAPWWSGSSPAAPEQTSSTSALAPASQPGSFRRPAAQCSGLSLTHGWRASRGGPGSRSRWRRSKPGTRLAGSSNAVVAGHAWRPAFTAEDAAVSGGGHRARRRGMHPRPEWQRSCPPGAVLAGKLVGAAPALRAGTSPSARCPWFAAPPGAGLKGRLLPEEAHPRDRSRPEIVP